MKKIISLILAPVFEMTLLLKVNIFFYKKT